MSQAERIAQLERDVRELVRSRDHFKRRAAEPKAVRVKLEQLQRRAALDAVMHGHEVSDLQRQVLSLTQEVERHKRRSEALDLFSCEIAERAKLHAILVDLFRS